MEKVRKCGICHKPIMTHELALFHSGKGNLLQLHTRQGVLLIHRECAEPYETTSQLMNKVTDGNQNLDYLES